MGMAVRRFLFANGELGVPMDGPLGAIASMESTVLSLLDPKFANFKDQGSTIRNKNSTSRSFER